MTTGDIGEVLLLDDLLRRVKGVENAGPMAAHLNLPSRVTALEERQQELADVLARLAALELRYEQALQLLQQQAARMQATSADLVGRMSSGTVVRRTVIVRDEGGNITGTMEVEP